MPCSNKVPGNPTDIGLLISDRRTGTTLGPSARSTLLTLGELAEVLAALGKLGEAEVALRRVLAGLEATLGMGSPQTLSSGANLCECLIALGKIAEAEVVQRLVVAGVDAALGPRSPQAVNAADCLAKLLTRQGKLAEAEPLLRRVLKVMPTFPGTGRKALEAMLRLAVVLNALQRPAEAAPLFAHLLSTYTGVLGAAHPHTIEVARLASANRDAVDRLNNAPPASIGV